MGERGIVLKAGTVAVLALDGTLVYVEDVQPTYVAVVALPEQPVERTEGVFTAGRVGSKKISPYSQPDRIVPAENLSDKNREFIATYVALRDQHGANHIAFAPEAPAEVAKPPRERKSKRERKAGPKYLRRCVVCNQQPAHPNHELHNGGHDFVDPVDAAPAPDMPAAPVAVKKRGRKAAAPDSGGAQYRVVSADLSTAQAASDKFKKGNRFFRVFEALRGLPQSTGTFEQIIAAVSSDGGRDMTNAVKVTKRALKQLVDHGNVTRV